MSIINVSSIQIAKNEPKVKYLDTQPVSPLNPSGRDCEKLKEIVNGEQKDESSLSKSKYEHSPRVNGHVTQNGIYKGLIPTLLDSGSVVEVMPRTLAASMNLDTHHPWEAGQQYLGR